MRAGLVPLLSGPSGAGGAASAALVAATFLKILMVSCTESSLQGGQQHDNKGKEAL